METKNSFYKAVEEHREVEHGMRNASLQQPESKMIGSQKSKRLA